VEEKKKLAYSLDEFCQATSLSRTAAYAAIAAGTLRTFKSGKRRMVSARAAQEFITKLENASPVPAERA
jgi:hypothetical protein